MTAGYAERAITLTFQLGKGDFGGDGQNMLTLAGLRVEVRIEKVTAPATGQAFLWIYGLTLDHMNRLSKAGLVYQARDNKVQVDAGDAKSGMTTIFAGVVVEAYPDMRQMPNTAFFIRASPTYLLQLKPAPPVTFNGATKVETALTQILKGTGFSLENNGVNTVLAYPYFPGTAWSQIKSCVRAAGCFAAVDDVKKVFAIWPKNGSRSGSAPEISPATGMIGYPEFQTVNIRFRSLFDPSLKAAVGGKINVKSQLQAANGQFTLVQLQYDLASQLPDGPWEMTGVGASPGY